MYLYIINKLKPSLELISANIIENTLAIQFPSHKEFVKSKKKKVIMLLSSCFFRKIFYITIWLVWIKMKNIIIQLENS